MEKIDFKKQMRELYAQSDKGFGEVSVPAMSFLMVDGTGNPNTAKPYVDAVEALYSVSYALKFMSKKLLAKDYVVPPLEGLWWADDMAAFSARAKHGWHWTMMIMQPGWITAGMFEEALEATRQKKNLPSLPKPRLENYEEGRCVQILHIGSYDDEAPTLAKLHDEFLPTHNLKPTGKHHEIYISDPRKVIPVKLKTILRQPVESYG